MKVLSPFSNPDRRLWAYPLAVALVLLTLWIRLHIDLPFYGPVLIIFTMPIILSAYWGGIGPGLLATAVSFFSASYYLLPPVGSFAVASNAQVLQQVFLAGAGIVIGVICEKLHGATRRANAGRVMAETGQLAAARLAAIVEGSGDAIIGKTLEGIISSWNPAAETLFGYNAAEIVGQPIALLFPPELLREEDEIIARVTRGEVVAHYETVRLRKDGRRLQVSLTVSPIHDLAGKIIGASKILRDITARKESEDQIQSLQAERSFLADLVESSNDAIVARTNDGKIRSWNRAAELMFGYSAAEMVGQSANLAPAQRHEALAVIEHLRRGEPVIHYETNRPHKNGGEVQVSFTASLIRNQQGEIVGTSGILRDITERKRREAHTIALQNELAHVARLSAMGQMSAAIAHELNQPLTAVVNYVSAAQRMLASQDLSPQKRASALEAMEKASTQTLRAGAIIQNLREFVEKREADRSQEDLNIVVAEAIALGAIGGADDGVDLKQSLAPEALPVRINRIQIQQVLVNLIRNGIEAMAKSPQRVMTLTTSREGNFAIVTIRDTGPGLPPEILAKLFQPFVTTKETGMGIGLNICQSITEAHGGKIEASASSEAGAIFRISLPLDGD
jgi:two-component system, LuxR family, sensor kinase FixL